MVSDFLLDLFVWSAFFFGTLFLLLEFSLISFEREEGASKLQSLIVFIHIFPVGETWKMLEGTCLKIVQMKYL